MAEPEYQAIKTLPEGTSSELRSVNPPTGSSSPPFDIVRHPISYAPAPAPAR